MRYTRVSLKRVCVAPCRTLLSHHAPWEKHKQCPKVFETRCRKIAQDLYLEPNPLDWELLSSTQKRVQPLNSDILIFQTIYPPETRICYLWSVRPLLFWHAFISSVRIAVGLSRNLERIRIHQPLKACVSEIWMKCGQMCIKFINRMLKSFVVIISISTCNYYSSGNSEITKELNQTTKTWAAWWLLWALYLQKKQTISHLF